MIKKLFYIILVIVGLAFALVAPIDRSPLKEKSFYSAMMKELDTLQLKSHEPNDTLQVGWSRVSLVPDYTMPMAGYTPRDSFKNIHDTLYARILAINNGNRQVFMISLDLLLVPPVIKDNIKAKLLVQHKDDFIYFGATHTHNGLGGWQNSIGGDFIIGDYNEAWINEVTENILVHIEKARASMVDTKIYYFNADADEYVNNRLAGDEGNKDGKIRGLKFERSDGKKAVLFTYSAHATSISKLSRSLSGDYPAEVDNELSKQGWDFPMYMAGMVGSHSLTNVEGIDFELTKNAGEILAQKIEHSKDTLLNYKLPITTSYINVELGSSQLRILDNWKLRDWVFRALLGKLKAEITYLRMGNILFLGTSCDFSGELAVNSKLDSLASTHNDRAVITSFNGYYTGYITEDRHYDLFRKKEEVRAMNWVGPYYGEYYSSILKKLLDK